MTQFLSASKLNGYRECPRKYKEFPPRDPWQPTDIFDFGTAVHAGMAAHFSGQRTFQEGFAEIALELGAPLDTERAMKGFRAQQDHKLLQIDPAQVLCIESNDATQWKHGKLIHQAEMKDGWGFEGMFDLVDTFERNEDLVLRVTDWKTGFSTTRDDMQLAIYALMAWRIYGFEKIRTGFFYLDQGRYDYSDWDEHSLVGALTYLEKLVRAFQAEKVWPERGNLNCRYCTIKGNCKTYSRLLSSVPVESRWDIEENEANLPTIIKVLSEVEVQSKVVVAVEKQLKQKRNRLLKLKNDVEVDGVVHHLYEYVTNYQYDLERLFTRTTEVLGRPPYEVLSLDSGSFDDLVAALDPVNRRALKELKLECRKPAGTSVKVSPRIDKAATPMSDDEEIPEVPPTGGRPTPTEPAPANAEAGSSSPTTETTGTGTNAKPAEQTTSGESTPTAPSSTPIPPAKRSRGPYLVCLACGDYETEKKPANRCPCGGQEFIEVKTKGEAVQTVASKVTPPKESQDLVVTLCLHCGQIHTDRPDAIAVKCRGCGAEDKMSRQSDFKTAKENSLAVVTKQAPAAPPAPVQVANPGDIITLCWNCGEIHCDQPDTVAVECRGCGRSDAMSREPDLRSAELNSQDIKIALGAENQEAAA